MNEVSFILRVGELIVCGEVRLTDFFGFDISSGYFPVPQASV